MLDTKLKNIRYSGWTKFFAILLCIASVETMAWGFVKAPYFQRALQQKDQLENNASSEMIGGTFRNLNDFFERYTSREAILSGVTVTDDEVLNRLSELKEEQNNKIEELRARYRDRIVLAQEEQDAKEMIRLQTERDTLIQEQQKLSATKDSVRQALIQQQLEEYDQQMSSLMGQKSQGIYWQVKMADGRIYTNNSPQAESKDASVISRQFKAGESVDLGSEGLSKVAKGIAEISVSAEKKQLSESSTRATHEFQMGQMGLVQVAAGAILFLMTVGYLAYSAGRIPGGEGVVLNVLDKPWTDLNTVVVGLITLGSVAAVGNLYNVAFEGGQAILYGIGALIIAADVALCIYWGMTVSKRIKRGELLRHSLIGWAFVAIVRLIQIPLRKIREALDGGPLARKLFLGIVGYCLLMVIGMTMLLESGEAPIQLVGLLGVVGLNGYVILVVMKRVRGLQVVQEGVDRIKEGNLSWRMMPEGCPELQTLSESIHRIADGLKASVENEVRAERMKAELVTNVSHDLKTPLTSIITYIDLIQKEGLDSPEAPKYLGILEQKAERLKTLTEDLFEAAKASSGNVAVELGPVAVMPLIQQGMGELSDQIQQSGLDVIIHCPDESLVVTADGKLLWRVLENLFSNVFKYAQMNSRVYLNIQKHHGMIQMVMKNISAYPLNISPEELMERFKRGDESRNSEGSGLGLGIARSLTELQQGRFTIAIDGDLFKATIEIPESIDIVQEK